MYFTYYFVIIVLQILQGVRKLLSMTVKLHQLNDYQVCVVAKVVFEVAKQFNKSKLLKKQTQIIICACSKL